MLNTTAVAPGRIRENAKDDCVCWFYGSIVNVGSVTGTLVASVD